MLGIPLLVLANKCDLIDRSDNSAKEQTKRLKNEIYNYFELNKIENREWKFLFTSVKTNYNVNRVVNMIFSLIF